MKAIWARTWRQVSVRWWRAVAALGLLAIALPAAAVDVTDLYTGVVPVADQSESARIDGQVAALQQVLVKLSGASQVLNLPQIQANLGKAAAYVQRYQYQLVPAPLDAPAGAPGSLMLQVSFDGRVLERLLQESAAPIWGARRPLTLVWFAVADENGRRLIGHDDEPVFMQELQFAARARGLPVVLPQLDLEETNQINISDVWGRFLEPLQSFSSRYGAEAVLAGRLEKLGDSWQGEISFQQGSLRNSFQSNAPSRAGVIQQLLGSVAEFVASKYAVVLDPSKDAEVLVKVHNVRRLEDYGQLSQFFSALQAVRQADIREVNGTTALFSLRLIADQSALLQATALDPRLQVVAGSEFGAVLEFDWRP